MSQLFPASPLRAAALAALCVAALPQSALATNGYFSHGYGTQSKAMAGTGVARSLDTLAPATNPAGLLVVSDGSNVKRYDPRLNVFRQVPLGATPLSTFLARTVDVTVVALIFVAFS